MDTCKKMIRLVPIFSFGGALLLLVSGILLSNVPANEFYTYENGVIVVHSWQNWFWFSTEILLFLVLCGVAVVTVLCIVSKIKWKEAVAVRLLISWVVGVVCLFMIVFSQEMIFGLFGSPDGYDPECYTFTNGQHTLVIEEESFLLGGRGTIYQVKNDNTAVVVGRFYTDDGLRNKGVYQIKWFEDSAEITYQEFFSGATNTETVHFEP